MNWSFLKVSRSWNKLSSQKLLPKNKRTNLFFYPDDSKILETWILISIFKYFQVVCFWGEVTARHFCFEIYWPLEADFEIFKVNIPYKKLKLRHNFKSLNFSLHLSTLAPAGTYIYSGRDKEHITLRFQIEVQGIS